MGVSLDLRKAAFHRQHGDILAVYTWVNDERALVLLPALRAPGSPWFIVCESAAYKYENTAYLAQQAAKAAEVLGMDECSGTAFRIANIIIEGIGDLIRLPHAPAPDKQSASIGEMKLMADGVQIGGEDIILDKEAPQYG